MKTFLFLDATKIQFKAKESERNLYTLCLGNISRDFTINNIKKKAELNGTVNVFSVDYNAIDISNILDMYRYLMNEMFGFIKKIFIVLLTSLVNSLSHTKVYP